MWLGELITEYGIGNGISLIIFAGIVGRSPQNVGRIAGGGVGGFGSILLLALVAIGATVLIITFQEAQRRIPIQSAQRVVGNKISQARASFLPLRLTGAGVIPIIFAISIMFFPTQIAQFFPNSDIAKFILRDWSASGPNLPVTISFNAVYFLLVFMFTFFYTSVQYDTNDMADNLKKYATFIPGIRPGKPTAEYLSGVLLRITVAGGLFLGFITVVLPLVTATLSGIPPTTFYLGSTGILIVVAVALDTMRQIETQLQMRQYRGFIR
jgi:preprotein translocase subunit SecY